MTYRLAPTVLLLLVFVAVAPARAQTSGDAATAPPVVRFEPLSIPPGPLPPGRLALLAETIVRLEAHPAAEGADRARQQLFRWLAASPDVTVTLCQDISQPFLEGDDTVARRMAFVQYLLSTAAHKIQNPAAGAQAANQAGLDGALTTYAALRDAAGASAPLEDLLEHRQAGTLGAYIEDGLAACESAR